MNQPRAFGIALALMTIAIIMWANWLIGNMDAFYTLLYIAGLIFAPLAALLGRGPDLY